MIEFLKELLFSLVLGFMYMYIWGRIINKKYNFKCIKLYYIYVLVIGIILNFISEMSIFKLLLISILFIPLIKVLFEININTSFMVLILSQIISISIDLIIRCLYKLLFNNYVDTYLISIISIYIIFIVNYFISNTKLIKNIIKNFTNKTNRINSISTFILFIIVLISYNYFISNAYYKHDTESLIIFNFIIIIGYSLIIYKFLNIKQNYNSINNKYLNVIDSLKEYEDMIDRYRICNHENKNQLLTIRSMIVNKENNIDKYIDTLIDTTITDNEKLMFETSVIPSGGLRAIIYSKMAYMKDNSIEVKLDVERSIRRIDLTLLDNNLILDICKIVGVFLDNAIEEVKKLENKEVKIKLFIENNNLCINIKNKYLKEFNVDKIEKCGYTTKGGNHGYGLTLVKNIIDENRDRLINNRSIDKNYFVQNLEIVNIK